MIPHRRLGAPLGSAWQLATRAVTGETLPTYEPLIGAKKYISRNKIAASRDEREAAFRLVYNKYVQAGLIDENDHRMRVTPWHLLPTTTVFVGWDRLGAASTVTLIGDGELGIPMESTYPDEVGQRRDAGKSFGEVSCLAFDQIRTDEFLKVFLGLNRLLAQYARQHGMDQLLIAVHPRHGSFYERFVGFEQIGPLRSYPTVQYSPAVAYCLDFARADRTQPPAYVRIFGEAISCRELESHPITLEEQLYFEPAAAEADHVVPLAAAC